MYLKSDTGVSWRGLVLYGVADLVLGLSWDGIQRMNANENQIISVFVIMYLDPIYFVHNSEWMNEWMKDGMNEWMNGEKNKLYLETI